MSLLALKLTFGAMMAMANQVSSFEPACVETRSQHVQNSIWIRHRLSLLALKPLVESLRNVRLTRCHRLSLLALKPCAKSQASSSVIRRETYEFAVDRRSCKNALHIDSSFNVKASLSDVKI